VHLPLRLPASQAATLDHASARQRPLAVVTLLANTCLMNFGFSILIPMLALHFTNSLGFTAAAIGLVLALRQIAQQGLDLPGGVFADRFGARTAITIGCFVRAAGFLGIGCARTLPELIGWAVVSGIGGAFFDASGTAALADLVAPHKRQQAFAASATMGNIGQTLGPLVGVALLGINFAVVGIAAAVCFVVVGLLTLALVPAATLRRTIPARPRDATAEERPRAPTHAPAGASLALLLRDRTFVWLTGLLAGFWFLWAQLNISVPLVAAQLGGARLAGAAFAINAGPAVLLQYPVARVVGRRVSARVVLAISVALCGVGMALAFAGLSVAIFVAGVGLFALARMLIWPTVNAVTADLAPEGRLGAYFGFGALAVAIGAGGGQLTGGMLYDMARSAHQPALLWGSMLVIGLGTGAGLLRLALPDGRAPRRAL
jgi:DHA1 family multidrug resistance protein-like MFS transporter